MNPVQESPSQPETMPKLPAPHEKLLRAPSLTEKMSQGKFKIILILIAIFLVVDAGIYMALIAGKTNEAASKANPNHIMTPPSSPTPTPLPPLIFPTINPKESTNWTTYTSPDKSFSFMYPSDWIVEKKINTSYKLKNGKTYSFTQLSFGEKYDPKERQELKELRGYKTLAQTPIMNQRITLTFGSNTDFLSLKPQDFISTEAAFLDNSQKGNLASDNSIKVEQFSYGCQNYCTEIIFQKDDAFYDFNTGPNSDQHLPILYQMIATFKFADQSVSNVSPTGKMCGGIAAFTCPENYSCKLDGDYPDAGGKCEKNTSVSPTSAPLPTRKEEQAICTQDIKVCPGGSYVSRGGPKCEFKACPATSPTTPVE